MERLAQTSKDVSSTSFLSNLTMKLEHLVLQKKTLFSMFYGE